MKTCIQPSPSPISKSPTTTRGALGHPMFLKLRVQITLKELAAKVCLMTPKKNPKLDYSRFNI